MREIKFRAWDGKKMYMPDQIIQVPGEECCTTGYYDASGYPKYSDHELMQYTGLKDKNGVEIYEGDVVYALYSDWPSGDYSKISVEDYMRSISEVGVISFDNRFGAEYIVDFGEDHQGSINVGSHGVLEIIGNIYENPELLEEKYEN